MIRSKAVIEVKIGNNSYQMECPNECALGEVHDALVQMRNIVIGIMQSHADQDQTKGNQDDE